jgi:phosphatidylglycerol---prolipoprotein diacylglyceryl transferase
LLTFPMIDPVLIGIGPIAIRWYALAYLAGILGGLYGLKLLNRATTPPLMNKAQLDDMLFYAVLGIIIGGRLGYVLFYQPAYYLANPAEIIAVWQGGMAFHGGMLGVIAAFYAFSRRHALPYLALMDRVACVAPIGLFFGMLANFINGELYGRVSDCALCMVFPHGGELPRHPSQLYQAATEGLVLFALLFVLRRHTSLLHHKGGLAGSFLLSYGLLRFGVEFFREPDAHLGLLSLGLSMGQWLCMPMVGLGLYLLLRLRYKPAA